MVFVGAQFQTAHIWEMDAMVTLAFRTEEDFAISLSFTLGGELCQFPTDLAVRTSSTL